MSKVAEEQGRDGVGWRADEGWQLWAVEQIRLINCGKGSREEVATIGKNAGEEWKLCEEEGCQLRAGEAWQPWAVDNRGSDIYVYVQIHYL